jgi:hypothetical protein
VIEDLIEPGRGTQKALGDQEEVVTMPVDSNNSGTAIDSPRAFLLIGPSFHIEVKNLKYYLWYLLLKREPAPF